VPSSGPERKGRGLKFEKKIFDNVHGYIGLTKEEIEIIDTPIFQRLRRISHLGLADFVYPGASHSRFSHAVGSMYVMTKLALDLQQEGTISWEDVRLLRLASLLHDVGHYPFSHVFDNLMQEEYGDDAAHEELSALLVLRTSLRRKIRKICKPDSIAAILQKRFRSPVLFQYLVTSSLDVDKIDYLQRDSLHTGVAYGAFDVDRLLNSVKVDRVNAPSKLVVSSKGTQSVEDFIIGRYHMFQSVYYHKSVVAFELMLDRVCRELLGKKLPSFNKIKSWISRHEDRFVDYDDAFVWNLIKRHSKGRSVTSELAKMLMSRTSLKMADENLTLSSSKVPAIMRVLAQEQLPTWISTKSGVDKKWIFYKKQPQVTFLEGDPETTVYIETKGNIIPIIDDNTSLIKKLWDSRYEAFRIYTKDNAAKILIENALHEALEEV
jgi:HD superfamily phosphohydrolase